MNTRPRVMQALGVLAFVVGFVGFTVFGWRFGDGANSPVAVVLALVAVAIAVVATLRNRR